MNKKISFSLAITIIIILAVLASVFIIWVCWDWNFEECPYSISPISENQKVKSCWFDSDCIIVDTIFGLDHIPDAKETNGGCQCVTSINKDYLDLWDKRREEFKGSLTGEMLICKPCGLWLKNSEAKCENKRCKAVAKKLDNKEVFSGIISDIDYGCTYDADCYIIVDGKRVIFESGSVIPPEKGSINGTLEVGKTAEVYARYDKDTGFWYLAGSNDYYIKVK